eukprot:s1915_g13.t1
MPQAAHESDWIWMQLHPAADVLPLWSQQRRIEVLKTTGLRGCRGDIRDWSNLVDLQSWTWTGTETSALVFMGDYVDRGPFGKQEFVRNLTVSFPHNVLAMMGNHDLYTLADALLPSGATRFMGAAVKDFAYAFLHPAPGADGSGPGRPPPKPKRNSVAAEIFICLDFEWTCDDGEQRQVHSDDVEIIEFSYVIYDAKDNRLAYERQHYCKNERTPITRFCSELTGITDQTLASAGSLADALEALRQDLEDEQLRGRLPHDPTFADFITSPRVVLLFQVSKDFSEFCALAHSLKLTLTPEELRKVFTEATAGRNTVSFESDEALLVLDLEGRQQDAAAVSAGVARALVAVLRPVGGMALIPMLIAVKVKALAVAKLCLLGAKKGVLFAKAKAALSLEAYMKNPLKLFRRQVISPLDPFRQKEISTVEAMRKEVRESGLKGLSTKSILPYAANAGIAMVMFHTYTTTRLMLHSWASSYPFLEEQPLCCEALAGASAGLMQATLHRCFQNYSFIMAQEVLALMSFFTSYEWLKLKTTSWVRHIDHSGEKDVWGWAIAACGSGVVLSAVGTPFENLLAWHVAERSKAQPRGVWKHFLKEPSRSRRMNILFGGMRSKLLVAPLAGLPLLAYEVMVQQGMAPRLHP